MRSHGRRLLARLAIAALVAGGIQTATATSASACGLPNAEHCYGIALSSPAGLVGVAADVSPSCLSTPANSFITNELWLVSSGSSYWVEVGWLQQGSGVNIGGHTTAGRFGFWADLRPNGGGFHTHILQTNPTLGFRTLQLERATSSTWTIHFGGLVDTSTGNAFTPVTGEWGSETTANTAHSYASGGSIMYKTSTGWHSGLPSTPSVSQNAPEKFVWNSKYVSYSAGVPC